MSQDQYVAAGGVYVEHVMNGASLMMGMRIPKGSGKQITESAKKVFTEEIGQLSDELAGVADDGFDASSFADEIIELNKATDGGGILLNGTPSILCN